MSEKIPTIEELKRQLEELKQTPQKGEVERLREKQAEAEQKQKELQERLDALKTQQNIKGDDEKKRKEETVEKTEPKPEPRKPTQKKEAPKKREKKDPEVIYPEALKSISGQENITRDFLEEKLEVDSKTASKLIEKLKKAGVIAGKKSRFGYKVNTQKLAEALENPKEKKAKNIAEKVPTPEAKNDGKELKIALAKTLVSTQETVTTAWLMSRLSVGENVAEKIIAELQSEGILGAKNSDGEYEVIKTVEEEEPLEESAGNPAEKENDQEEKNEEEISKGIEEVPPVESIEKKRSRIVKENKSLFEEREALAVEIYALDNKGILTEAQESALLLKRNQRDSIMRKLQTIADENEVELLALIETFDDEYLEDNEEAVEESLTPEEAKNEISVLLDKYLALTPEQITEKKKLTEEMKSISAEAKLKFHEIISEVSKEGGIDIHTLGQNQETYADVAQKTRYDDFANQFKKDHREDGLGNFIDELDRLKLPEFENLTPGQKMLVVQGLSDRLLPKTREDGEENFNKRASKINGLGKAFGVEGKFDNTTRLGRFRRKAAHAMNAIGNIGTTARKDKVTLVEQRKALEAYTNDNAMREKFVRENALSIAQGLTAMNIDAYLEVNKDSNTSMNPASRHKESNRNIIMNFAGNNFPNIDKDIFDEYNKAGMNLSKKGWQGENTGFLEKKEAAQFRFDEATRAMMPFFEARAREMGATTIEEVREIALKDAALAKYKAEAMSLFTSNPDATKKLNEIGTKNLNIQALKTFVGDRAKFTIGGAGLRMGTKAVLGTTLASGSALFAGLTIASIPTLAYVIGKQRGRSIAKEKLRKEQKKGRFGENNESGSIKAPSIDNDAFENKLREIEYLKESGADQQDISHAIDSLNKILGTERLGQLSRELAKLENDRATRDKIIPAREKLQAEAEKVRATIRAQKGVSETKANMSVAALKIRDLERFSNELTNLIGNSDSSPEEIAKARNKLETHVEFIRGKIDNDEVDYGRGLSNEIYDGTSFGEAGRMSRVYELMVALHEAETTLAVLKTNSNWREINKKILDDRRAPRALRPEELVSDDSKKVWGRDEDWRRQQGLAYTRKVLGKDIEKARKEFIRKQANQTAKMGALFAGIGAVAVEAGGWISGNHEASEELLKTESVKIEDAQKVYEEALNTDPNLLEAQAALARIQDSIDKLKQGSMSPDSIVVPKDSISGIDSTSKGIPANDSTIIDSAKFNTPPATADSVKTFDSSAISKTPIQTPDTIASDSAKVINQPIQTPDTTVVDSPKIINTPPNPTNNPINPAAPKTPINGAPAPLTQETIDSSSLAQVEFSSKGAGQTLLNFRNSEAFTELKNTNPEMAKFFEGDIWEVTQKLKEYMPNAEDGNESVVVGKGSTFGVTEDGRIYLTDTNNGGEINVLGKINPDGSFTEGDPNLDYIDTDSVRIKSGNTGELPMEEGGNTGELPMTDDGMIDPNTGELPMEEGNTGELPTYADRIEQMNTEEAAYEIPKDKYGENAFSLSEDELKKAHEIGSRNLNKDLRRFFVDENGKVGEKSNSWEAAKKAPTKDFLAAKPRDFDRQYRPFVRHVGKLARRYDNVPRDMRLGDFVKRIYDLQAQEKSQ